MDISAEIKRDGILVIHWNGESNKYVGEKCGEYILCRKVFAGKFPHGNRAWPMDVLVWPATGHIAIEEGGYKNKGGARIICGWYQPQLGDVA